MQQSEGLYSLGEKMNLSKCLATIEEDKKVIAPCQHLSYFPLVVDHCQGSIITDLDGNEFIDFLSSASGLNLGSCNPAITEAIHKQSDRFALYTGAYSYNEPMIRYAKQLASVYPGGIDVKVVFGNSGSDCNDAAVKFARAYTGRTKIITFLNGYHGSTFGSGAMSSCTIRMKSRMGPFPPEFYYFPFFGSDVEDAYCEEHCMDAMREAFATWLPANEVAAVVIEPMQGDGGLLPAHPIFMKQLYELCQDNGILFISEEVQQGLWRTGKWFSIEHYGIIPDGIVMGKSVGASLALGVFMGRKEIMDSLPAPAHVFTLSGNPLACAAGRAAFEEFQSETFQKQLFSNTELLEREAAILKNKHPDLICFVRNMGMSMGIGVRCGKWHESHTDASATFKILFRCYELGLIIISVGGNVLRVQPPLNIEPELIRKGFSILDCAMRDFESGIIPDSVYRYQAGW